MTLGVMVRVSHLLPLIALLWSAFAMAEDNAGIFFYGAPPSPDTIARLAEGATVSKAADGKTTRVTAKWPDVSVTVVIDPSWNREVQLSGIRGWLSQFPESERKSKPVFSFLTDLDRTTTCYGSIILPGYDRSGKAAGFLKRLLEPSGGFFFSHQSFYTAHGTRITGSSGDPSMLGPK